MPKENTDTQTTSETAKASIRGAIKKAIDWLKVRQAPDGMWNAPLETNCCMEAQWILAMHFIDFDDPKKPKVRNISSTGSAKTARGTCITARSTAT